METGSWRINLLLFTVVEREEVAARGDPEGARLFFEFVLDT